MKEKMTIIFFSGSLDKAMAMLILASTAASMGMEVSVFFTFWGLNFLKKRKRFSGKNILQKMMEFMMPKNMGSLPAFRPEHAWGRGKHDEDADVQKKMPPLEDLFVMAKEMKVKFYACSTSCGIMGQDNDNMIDGVEDVVGATSFLGMAKDSKINLFI